MPLAYWSSVLPRAQHSPSVHPFVGGGDPVDGLGTVLDSGRLLRNVDGDPVLGLTLCWPFFRGTLALSVTISHL